MTKGIFIAGHDSALLNAIEAEAAKRVERYAFASIQNRFSEKKEKPSGVAAGLKSTLEKTRIRVDWNPGSPVSTRALFLEAENSLGHIDEAILVCSPPSVFCAAADLKPADIEVLAHDHFKSWLFLTRELIVNFKTREQGALILVYPEAGEAKGKDNTTADILGSVATASFRVLTNRLLAEAPDEAYFAQGFTGGETGDETDFADFIFKQLDEGKRKSNGKLHKFKKAGLFK